MPRVSMRQNAMRRMDLRHIGLQPLMAGASPAGRTKDGRNRLLRTSYNTAAPSQRNDVIRAPDEIQEARRHGCARTGSAFSTASRGARDVDWFTDHLVA